MSRHLLVLTIGLMVLGGAPSAGASQPTGPPERSGDLAVVSPSNTTEELREGGSATEFAIELPPGSQCPGDSRFDDYRTQSFIVPADVDIATLEFGVNDPVGDGNWSLYMTDSSPYVDELLEPNEEPGQVADILPVPIMTFREFPVGLLPDGDYTIGIACTWFREITNWWDTSLRITSDPDDVPGQMRWVVTGVATGVIVDDDDSSRWNLLIPILAAGAVLLWGASFVAGRREKAPAGATDS